MAHLRVGLALGSRQDALLEALGEGAAQHGLDLTRGHRLEVLEDVRFDGLDRGAAFLRQVVDGLHHHVYRLGVQLLHRLALLLGSSGSLGP